MKNTRYENGLTLVELLVALAVASIVLAAVATLAYAMSSANNATDDTSQKQAHVRYATLRISELIRHCKLVCYATGDDLAIWRADDDHDGQINIGELVYIERGPARDYLRLCEFTSLDGSVVDMSSIGPFKSNWWSAYSSDVSYTRLLPECREVQFSLDELPPRSRLVSISFDIVENGIVHKYQVSAALRGWAGNLLDDDGNIVGDDD